MDRFLTDAASILETGLNVLATGQQPTDLVILTGIEGQNQVLADCDWALDAIRMNRGAACAYRITAHVGVVVVEGEQSGRRCRLEQCLPRGLTVSVHHRWSGPDP